MNKQELFTAVLASEDLPTLPTIASRLVTLTSKDETTLGDVADLVSQDVALSSKILKVANSAFYNFSSRISTIHQAVSMLGTNAVQSLVLSFSFLGIEGKGKNNAFDFEKYWERSLASAVCAKLILEKVPGANAEEIFISGLLQNLGVLILACAFPDEYSQVIAAINKDSLDSRRAETSIFGADHCYIGYEVAKHWHFPESIVIPVLHHHNPLGYTDGDEKIEQSTKAIYLSDLLLNILYSDKPEEYHRQFREEAAKLLRLKPEAIEAILDEAHTGLELAGNYFGMKIDGAKPVQRILQEANIRLSLLNLDYEQMNMELIEAKIALENITKELREKNALLKSLADADGLTGAYNHRFFQAAIEKEMSRASRKENDLALLLIDIDEFKRFNDTHGHLTGDYVLTEFTKVLQANLRQYDTLARYGGEEFVVILPETSEQEACMVAEKLRDAVDKKRFSDGGEKHHVTASFGIACVSGSAKDSISKTDLIRNADQALYNAKDKGRNCVVLYSEKKKWYGLR